MLCTYHAYHRRRDNRGVIDDDRTDDSVDDDCTNRSDDVPFNNNNDQPNTHNIVNHICNHDDNTDDGDDKYGSCDTKQRHICSCRLISTNCITRHAPDSYSIDTTHPKFRASSAFPTTHHPSSINGIATCSAIIAGIIAFVSRKVNRPAKRATVEEIVAAADNAYPKYYREPRELDEMTYDSTRTKSSYYYYYHHYNYYYYYHHYNYYYYYHHYNYYYYYHHYNYYYYYHHYNYYYYYHHYNYYYYYHHYYNNKNYYYYYYHHYYNNNYYYYYCC
nr:hypothetical protein BaRGS_023228 [Batillaria attramentaria]